MPLFGNRPPGGGGGGLSLGPEQNEFTTNTARDTYAGANAAWLAQYNANRLFIILVGGTQYQRRNVAGTAWEVVTPIAQGSRGPTGAQGPPGVSPAATTNTQVDAVGSTDTDIDAIQSAAQAGYDDAGFMSLRKSVRLLARVIKRASATQLGMVLKARNQDVDASETDTGRVLDVVSGKRLIQRLLAGYAALTGATFTGAVSGPAPTADDHLATKEYVDTDALNRVLGAILPGENITIDRNTAGQITISATSAGPGPEPSDTQNHCGISLDLVIDATELSLATNGAANALLVPTFSGRRHVFFLRPASAGAVTEVYLYEQGHRNTSNQSSAFTAVDVTLNGVRYLGVISTDSLASAANTIMEVV